MKSGSIGKEAAILGHHLSTEAHDMITLYCDFFLGGSVLTSEIIACCMFSCQKTALNVTHWAFKDFNI